MTRDRRSYVEWFFSVAKLSEGPWSGPYGPYTSRSKARRVAVDTIAGVGAESGHLRLQKRQVEVTDEETVEVRGN